jgi:ribosomal protein L7/L12
MPTCPFCEHDNPAEAERCAKCGAALTDIQGARDEGDRVLDGATPVDTTGQTSGGKFEQQLEEVLRSGGKIAAIKLYREQTGKGLKESKDAVEAFARERQIPIKQAGCGTTVLAVVLAVIIAVGLAVAF